ncbi:MAG: helix-turn-helix transcriptional regulator [Mucilaginibacter sp.]|nr:helix-turn-helix transcriptional regulator [Mucilaginibacter sp.]
MSALKKTVQSSFCKKIKDLRHEREWSQEYLACRMGISAPSISKIEAGITAVTLSNIERLAHIYEVPLTQLLSAEDEIPPKILNGPALNELKRKLATRELEILVLQRKVIELYEELQCNKLSA